MPNVLTRENVAQALGPAVAGPDAQRTGGGLGIENIRRGVGRAVLTDLGSDITVSATSFASLSTPLVLDIVLSGRPLRVDVGGLWSVGSSGVLRLDITLRGVSMSDNTNGVAYSNVGGVLPFHGFELVMAPVRGAARIEVVALRETANGTIYAGANNRVLLTAVEL